jgi:DNA-binding transcriptional ArsR family regulator
LVNIYPIADRLGIERQTLAGDLKYLNDMGYLESHGVSENARYITIAALGINYVEDSRILAKGD